MPVSDSTAVGAVDFDAELRLYSEILSPAWGIEPGDRVVDIGCGAGQTTRQAARLATAGDALGVDVSAPAVAQARRLTEADGPRNVTFECADAQAHRFPDQRFDLAISRFGTMFFSDPTAAFGNVGRALRPAGRLVMLVWQAKRRNEWAVIIDDALGAGGEPDEAPAAFSLGDPTTTTATLHAAGFVDVAFMEVRKPVYYGPDPAAALAWIHSFSTTRQAVERLDPHAAAQALHRLRDILTAHLSADGVWLDSSAWIVTAHRPA